MADQSHRVGWAPIGLIARSQLRRRRGVAVAMALVLASVGGLSIALVEGARRSSTAVDRYRARSTPYTMLVHAPGLTVEQIRSVPGVVAAAPSAYVALQVVGAERRTTPINTVASEWSHFDPSFRVLEGERPADDDHTSVLVNREAAKMFGFEVGEVVTVQGLTPEQQDVANRPGLLAAGPRFDLRVAGILQTPTDLARDEITGSSQLANFSQMIMSWGLYEPVRASMADFGGDVDVQLADGLEPERFMAEMRALVETGGPASEAEVGPDLYFGPPSYVPSFAALRAPVRMETTMLWGLAVLATVCGTATIGLLFRAERRSHRLERGTLAQLGFTRRALGAVGALRTLPAALVGATFAVGLAVALSPRFPIGVGRQVEPSPGLELRLPPLVLGWSAMVAIALVLGFIAELGAGSEAVHASAARSRAKARRSGGPSLPMNAWLGARLAFGAPPAARRATGLVPVVAAVLAVAALAAGAVVDGGLGRLYEDKPTRGIAWDLAIGNAHFPAEDWLAERVHAEAGVASAIPAQFGAVLLDGNPVDLLAADLASSPLAHGAVLDGRLPRGPDEIALGASLMHSLGVDAGDHVNLTLADGDFDTGDHELRDRSLLVVGTALVPSFWEGDLAMNAIVDGPVVIAAGGQPQAQLLLASLHPDADRDATVAALERDLPNQVTVDIVPARVVTLWRARDLPVTGALILAGLGLVACGFTIAAGGRARSREQAVLRSLGLDGRQHRRVCGWHGTLLAASAVALGVPLGVALGAVLWRRTSTWLGVPNRPDVAGPLLVVLVLTAASLSAIAYLIGVGRRRHRLVDALRVG